MFTSYDTTVPFGSIPTVYSAEKKENEGRKMSRLKSGFRVNKV